jgi:outer membrane protein OmpA-like peptidoglycan-associated protein
LDLVGSANFSVQRPRPVTVVTTTTTVAPTATTVAPTATTVAPTATTIASTATTVAPSALASRYVNAVPGITVTDPVVYRTAPKRVAENSAVIVLTAQQTRTLDVVSRTPAVCLPNDNDLVFINQGSCIADVVNQRTRAVLRTLRTKVVGDNIEQLLVGNEIVTLAPVYFDRMSAFIDAKGRQTLNTIRPQAIAAGSILVMGHSGIIYGNSPENKKVANDRAMAVMQALKSFGVKAPFATSSLGANDPASKATSEKAQDRNRRVIIALIP